jgi:molecular chaperone DnaK
MTRLIDRNTTIPTRKSQIFSTAADSQTSVEVHVLQGEREMAADNRTLAKFILDGIPSAPRGVPQVEVTFDIDANGIVHVAAADKATNKEQKIQITASSGLSKDDIDRFVKDAQSHESEDKKRREEIDIRNQADALVYSTEKTLAEHRSKVAENDAKAIDEALAACKKAIESKDSGQIRSAMEALTRASHKMAEAMYKASSGAAGSQPGAGPAPGDASGAAGAEGQTPPKKKDDNVIDAEFEEMK